MIVFIDAVQIFAPGIINDFQPFIAEVGLVFSIGTRSLMVITRQVICKSAILSSQDLRASNIDKTVSSRAEVKSTPSTLNTRTYDPLLQRRVEPSDSKLSNGKSQPRGIRSAAAVPKFLFWKPGKPL